VRMQPAVEDRHSPADEEVAGGRSTHVPNGCGGTLRYCFEHDASYCPGCDVWTEKACSGAACEYCGERPERPSDAHLPDAG
jgi:hypothetical protein